MSKAKDFLNLIEQQGQGKPPAGTGGPDTCVCPECGYEEAHERGIPCNTKTCSECDTKLTGKGMVGSKVNQ